MSEEPLIKDGAISFSPATKNSRKPNVIYYDINQQSTGVDYIKSDEKNKKTFKDSLTYRLIISFATLLGLASIIGAIYLVISVIRKRNKEPEKKIVIESEEGSIEERVVEEEKEPQTLVSYFKSLRG